MMASTSSANELVHINEDDIATIKLVLDESDHFPENVVPEFQGSTHPKYPPLPNQRMEELASCHGVHSVPNLPRLSRSSSNPSRAGSVCSNSGEESSTISSTPSPLQTQVADILHPTCSEHNCTRSGVFIPDSAPLGGPGFKVQILSSRKSECCFNEDTKTLFVNKNVDIAVQFKLSSILKQSGYMYAVRAMVSLKKPEDIEKLGPVVVLASATDSNATEHSDHFLLCRNTKAVYSELCRHKIVTVPLVAMPESSEGGSFTAVYTCSQYSSHFVGRGVKKPTMIVIFSLFQDGIEIARDYINMCCMSSLVRDVPKRLKREAETSAGPRTTKRPRRDSTPRSSDSPSSEVMTNIPKMLDFVGIGEKDADGYYTFVCKTKDRSFYNLLKFLKLTHGMHQETNH